MKTNQCFSFARLGLVMKRDLMENWKRNLYVFLGIFLAFLGLYLINLEQYDFEYNDNYIENAVSTYINNHVYGFIIIASFLLLYFTSEIMRDMRTKEARLSYLMLPATLLEKFVSKALYVTVGVMGMIVVALFLAEAAHFIFIPFFDNLRDEFKIFVWPELWEKIGKIINPFQMRKVYLNVTYGTDPSTWQCVEKSMFFIFSMGYTATLWQHSIFVLGGNYFGKHPMIKTVAIMILIGGLMGWACTLISLDDLSWIDDFIQHHSNWLTEEMVAGFISFVFLAFTALNWWLSYKLFTRRQVIEPKFRLL